MTTQIVAGVSTDPRAARRVAAAQVGFYSTPKGYDALFPDGQFAAERIAAREALARGDVAGVIAAGDAMVEERAVFGAPEDVAGQLRRYADVMRIPVPSAPYQDTIGPLTRVIRGDAGGTALGDPAKVAAVVVRLAGMTDPPVRLLLGSDALTIAQSAARTLAAQDAAWSELSRSTDRDDATDQDRDPLGSLAVEPPRRPAG